MTQATLENARPPRRHRWLKRIGIVVGTYLAVGFLTSFFGLNLIGAVFNSGPLVGRVVDENGNGVSGAFVAYEWQGQSYHGTTGCKAAALVRTAASGRYVVPWQGWRLVTATGWGIGPVGPAVWAPGYVAKGNERGGVVLISKQNSAASTGTDASGSVDKGACFGWPYRDRWLELLMARTDEAFDKTCVAKSTLRAADLAELSGDVIGIAVAREGALLPTTAITAALDRKYRAMLEQLAWPKKPADSGAMTTPEQRDGFCAAVKTDYLAFGGQFK